MLTSLFPILATEYAGLTTAQAGALYLITPLLAFTGPLWGRLSDRVSRSLVLSVRGFANIASALVYLFAPNLVGFWTGKSLDDLGKAAFRPAWGSLMADISSQDRRKRARIMGYLSAGEDAGDVAAPVVAGLLWTGFGVPAVLLGRVGLAVVAEAYMLWLTHRAAVGGRGRHRRPRHHRAAHAQLRQPPEHGAPHEGRGGRNALGRAPVPDEYTAASTAGREVAAGRDVATERAADAGAVRRPVGPDAHASARTEATSAKS
jgi:MFS family permease